MRVAAPVNVTPEERAQLDQLVGDPTVPSRTQVRAWIVLRAAQGAKNRSIAREFLIDVDTVGLWRRRFLVHRLPGILADAPRSGRKPRIPASTVARIVSASRRPMGPGSQAPSSREIARGLKVSQSTVVRIWRTHQIRASAARREEPGEGTTVPRPVRDVRAVYLVGIDRAVVFTTSRTPEEAARNPEEGALSPLAGPASVNPSRGSGVRKPTRDPLAALRVLYRTSLAAPQTEDRVQEFLLFLRGVQIGLPPEEEAHVVLCSEHLGKEAEVLRWLQRHPAFVLYSAKPDASGRPPELVLPEGLFLRSGRGGSLRALPGLIDSFRHFLGSYDRQQRPFVWRSPSSLDGIWKTEPVASGPKGPVELSRTPLPAGPSPLVAATGPGLPSIPPLSLPALPAALSGGYRSTIELHSGSYAEWLRPLTDPDLSVVAADSSPAPTPRDPEPPKDRPSSTGHVPTFAPFLLGGRVGRPPNRAGNGSK